MTTHVAGGLPRTRSDRLAVWVLAVGALDFGLEQFAVVPILPAVQRASGASLTATTWLLTGFLLASVAAAPVIGRLGDLWGRRRLLLVSLGAFAAGSLVCALAGSVEELIAGRVVQGLGAALGPLAIGLARDHAPPGRAPVWIGVLVASAGAGAALGLLVGGLFVDYVSVAAVFWFLFGLAAALVLAVWALLPTAGARDTMRPDWWGGLLLAAGLLILLLAISKGNEWGWGSARAVGLFAASAAILTAFVVFERSVSAPLVDIRSLARRAAWSANLVAFAMGLALFIAAVVIPQLAALPLASGYGFELTTVQTGLILLPGALTIFGGGWLGGLLVRTMGARVPARSGAVCAVAAYLALAVSHTSLAAVVTANAVLGLGIGLALLNLVVHAVDYDRTSIFAATATVSRSTGAALGAQVAAAIILAAGVTAAGLPAESGYTGAFVLGIVGSVVALVATVSLPARAADPSGQTAG